MTRAIALVGFIVSLLFLASSAGASIPGIQETSQWKSLASYVTELQAKSTTPATAEQKSVYTSNLAAKQEATNNRVKALYQQRIQKIKKRDQAKENKQIRKLARARDQQLLELGNKRSQKIASIKSQYAANVAAIEARFGTALQSRKAQLASLRRSLRKTNNPFQRQVLLAHIDTVQRNISRTQQALQRGLRKAASQKSADIAATRTRFALRLQQTRSYYKGLQNKVLSAWKIIYKDEVQSAKATRQKQFDLVSAKRQAGNTAIATMPNVVS